MFLSVNHAPLGENNVLGQAAGFKYSNYYWLLEMYINKEIQNDILSHLQQCKFRELCDKYFHENFLWTIKGTSILSGTYKDKDNFFNHVIARISQCLTGDWKMHILGAYAADNAFIVEMRGEVKTKKGGNYDNDYCWIFKFADNKVVSLTAYYDSLLVNKTLLEHEKT